MMEALRIIAASSAFCALLAVIVLAIAFSIVINRLISHWHQETERKMNIDAEAMEMKRISGKATQ